MIKLKLKSLNKEILITYQTYILKVLEKINTKYSIINLPTKIKKITVLKSPHVYKKAREQFQISIFKTTLNISTINSYFIKHLLLNKPSTIKIKIIRGIV